MKWTCKRCTFQNLPFLRGCQMCSTSRPTDFYLPSGYTATNKEKRFENRLVQSRKLITKVQDLLVVCYPFNKGINYCLLYNLVSMVDLII